MVRVPSGTPGMQYRAPEARYGRSQFSLSHNHKTTFLASYLTPYFLTEVIPGDTMTCKLDSFIRIVSPLDAPLMDNIEVDIHFFYVPNRLVWTDWEEFLGASAMAGAQPVDYTLPLLSSSWVVGVGEVGHYMGLPVGLDMSQVEVQALPVRCYGLIYNEWYRDQNLIDEVTVNMGSSGGFTNWPTPLKSAKKPDYFTTALPYLQKGDAVTIPFTGTIDVQTAAALNAEVTIKGVETTPLEYRLVSSTADVTRGGTFAGDEMFVDLSNISAGGGVTINALREAAAVQRLLERDARGGTRHPELIRAHFGVDVPDHRTQRPEYLGGGRGFINVTPVANTSDTTTWAQGELAGIGTGQLRARWAKSFVEHGHVLGILRARADLTYHQGLDRMWSRSTRYDFLWPELAHLGEQAILNKEIFVSNVPATDDAVFGYQERYAEYRFKKSLVTGILDPAHTTPLDFWHLAEDFGSLPALNQTFIEDQTPMARVMTVSSGVNHFVIDGRFDLRVARVLPVRPVPSLAPARF